MPGHAHQQWGGDFPKKIGGKGLAQIMRSDVFLFLLMKVYIKSTGICLIHLLDL